MTGDFVYEALISELEQWKNNCDDEKYDVVYDYLEDVAYEIGVSPDDTPAGIVDNIIINGDFAYEGEDRYERALRHGDYVKQGDGILFLG